MKIHRIPLDVVEVFRNVQDIKVLWNPADKQYDIKLMESGEGVSYIEVDRLLLEGRDFQVDFDTKAHGYSPQQRIIARPMAMSIDCLWHIIVDPTETGGTPKEKWIHALVDDAGYRNYRYALGGVGFGDPASASRGPLRSRFRRRR